VPNYNLETVLDPTRRLGRLPGAPKDTNRRLALRKYVSDMEPVPPTCDWTGSLTNWLMLMNDQLGDCGIAAMFHGTMSKLASLLTTPTILAPTDAEVVAFYSAAGGYRPGKPWTDAGVNNPTMLSLAQKQGYMIGGQKRRIGPYAQISGSDVATIQQGIYFLGGALFGIELSKTCYDNFGPGNVWDVDGSRIIGGHDVWAFGYNDKGPLVVTWGQPTQCTWAWAAQYADDIEAIAEADAFVDPVSGLTPNGLALAAWQADVTQLTGQAA
jgi:hypothetical protein